jgi:hypothetical protein
VRLREELFLLGHDPSGRAVVPAHSLDLGAAGALLAELAQSGRLAVSGGHVTVADTTPTADAEIDRLLLLVLRSPAAPPLGAVLTELHPGAADRVRAGLAAAGVVREVGAKRLGLIPVTRYPADEAAVRRITVGLWYAAHGRDQPDDRTAALLALVHAVQLHGHVFGGMPMNGLGARLTAIRDRGPAPVREIATAVSALVPRRPVAIYR